MPNFKPLLSNKVLVGYERADGTLEVNTMKIYTSIDIAIRVIESRFNRTSGTWSGNGPGWSYFTGYVISLNGTVLETVPHPKKKHTSLIKAQLKIARAKSRQWKNLLIKHASVTNVDDYLSEEKNKINQFNVLLKKISDR